MSFCVICGCDISGFRVPMIPGFDREVYKIICNNCVLIYCNKNCKHVEEISKYRLKEIEDKLEGMDEFIDNKAGVLYLGVLYNINDLRNKQQYIRKHTNDV